MMGYVRLVCVVGLWAILAPDVLGSVPSGYFSEPNPYSSAGRPYGTATGRSSQVHAEAADVASVLKRRQLATMGANVSTPKVNVSPEVQDVIIGFGQMVEAASGNPGVFTPDRMSALITTMAVEHPAFPAKIAEFVQAYGTPIVTAPASSGSPAAVARDAMIKFAATTPGMHEPMMTFFEESADVVVGSGYFNQAAQPRGLMPGLRAAMGPADLLFAPLDKFQEAATSFGSTMASMSPFGSMMPMGGGLLDTLGGVMGGPSTPERDTTTQPAAQKPNPYSTPTPGRTPTTGPYGAPLATPYGVPKPNPYGASAPNPYTAFQQPPAAHAIKMPSPYLNMPVGGISVQGPAQAPSQTYAYQGAGYPATTQQAYRPPPPGVPAFAAPGYTAPPGVHAPPPGMHGRPPAVYAPPAGARPPPMLYEQQYTGRPVIANPTPLPTTPPSYLGAKQPRPSINYNDTMIYNRPPMDYNNTMIYNRPPAMSPVSRPTYPGVLPQGADVNQPNVGMPGPIGATGKVGGQGGPGTVAPKDLSTVPTIAANEGFDYTLSSGSAQMGALPSFANLFPFTKTISVAKNISVTPTAGTREADPMGASADARTAADSIGQGRLNLVTQLYDTADNQKRRLAAQTPSSSAVAARSIADMASAIGQKFGNANTNRSMAQSLVSDYLEPLGMTDTMAEYLQHNYPYLQAAPIDPATPHAAQDPFHKIFNVFTSAFKYTPPTTI